MKTYFYFILLTDKHVINYISKYSFYRYKHYINYNDMKQEVIRSFYETNITTPINHKDEKIYKMFRQVAKFARNEKKHSMQKKQGAYEHAEYMQFQDLFEISADLSEQEYRICKLIMDGVPVFDILMDEKITFERYKKILRNLKKIIKE